jgi:hypothetical protein
LVSQATRRAVLGVHIPLLRVDEFLLHDAERIRGDEPPYRRGMVAFAEVVQPGFGIAFFASELVDKIDDSS